MLPRGLSTLAPAVDRVFYELCAVTCVVFVGVVGTMLVFVWRYHRRPGDVAHPPNESVALEIVWIGVPLLVCAYFFHHGFLTYMQGRVAPHNALEIRVVARQWSLDFTHPNGLIQTNELTVPAGRPIKLLMSSQDVIHSFYVPELRVQHDIVPGMYSTLWFEIPETTGAHPLIAFCGSYCGAPHGIEAPSMRDPIHVIDNQNSNHATMLALLNVVAPPDYDCWVNRCWGDAALDNCAGRGDDPVCLGEQNSRSYGCTACHSADPTIDRPGPSLATIWGTRRDFEDGTFAVADEAYIRESITNPQAHVVRGYMSPRMPDGRLSSRQLADIAAYIRSIAVSPPPDPLPDAPSRRRRRR